jgi:hypothetical protein
MTGVAESSCLTDIWSRVTCIRLPKDFGFLSNQRSKLFKCERMSGEM